MHMERINQNFPNFSLHDTQMTDVIFDYFFTMKQRTNFNHILMRNKKKKKNSDLFPFLLCLTHLHVTQDGGLMAGINSKIFQLQSHTSNCAK